MTHKLPRLVALIAPFGSGKTELATIMTQLTPNARMQQFAAPIRDGLAAMGIQKERHNALYRRGAQFVGQMCRNHDPDWWVQQTEIALSAYPDTVDTVFLDDVRYENEIDFVCENGGTLIFVDASERIAQDMRTNDARAHESEEVNNLLYDEFSSPLDTRLVVPGNHFHPELGRHFIIARNHTNQEGAVARALLERMNLEVAK